MKVLPLKTFLAVNSLKEGHPWGLLLLPCTHHCLQPGAECGWESGQQLHAFFCLGVKKCMSQPLPCQHEQLRCQNFFVMDLQDGLRMIIGKNNHARATQPVPGGCQRRAVSVHNDHVHGQRKPKFLLISYFFLLPKFSIEYDNILSLSERDHPSLTFVILAYEWMPTRPYSLLTRPGRHTGFLALDLAKLVPISGPLHSLLFHRRHGSLSSLSG